HRPLAYQLIDGRKRKVETGYVLRSERCSGIQVSRRLGPLRTKAQYLNARTPEHLLRERSNTSAVQVAFRIGSYDRARELIIDPVLSYSTYLGGSDHDEGYAVATDAAG